MKTWKCPLTTTRLEERTQLVGIKKPIRRHLANNHFKEASVQHKAKKARILKKQNGDRLRVNLLPVTSPLPTPCPAIVSSSPHSTAPAEELNKGSTVIEIESLQDSSGPSAFWPENQKDLYLWRNNKKVLPSPFFKRVVVNTLWPIAEEGR